MFHLTWQEVLELMLNRVLTFPVCRAIIRKSGIRSRILEAVRLPPGGKKGQILVMRRTSNFITRLSTGNIFFWADTSFNAFVRTDRDRASRNHPLYAPYTQTAAPGITGTNSTLNEAGIIASEADWSKTPPNPLGVGPRRIIHFGSLRNPVGTPDYYLDIQLNDTQIAGDYFGTDNADVRMRPIANHRARQFFIWDDIPAGTWYYPLNLDNYNKKVDFRASLRMDAPIMTRVLACVVEGNPDAELQLCYSTGGRTGPWSELASVDLQPGGPRRSPKALLPDAAKDDVFVCLRLRARSNVSRLHLAYATATAEWLLPTDTWQRGQHDWTS